MKGKKVRLTKLKDTRFNGEHPNGINAGYVMEGWMQKEVTAGEKILLYTKSEGEMFPTSWTSTVTAYNEEDGLISTKNSIYEIKIIK